jgi:lysophospholipase L1-like esterase
MNLRSFAFSITLALAAGLLAPLGALAEEKSGLELLTGADTPLRENDRIGFIGDSITMQGGFIRLVREGIGQSDHTKNLGVQLFQHGLNGGRVDSIVEGVTPWGKQDPFSKLLEKDKPTIVVIYLGVNDVTHGGAVSPEAFESGLGKLVSEAKQAGAMVILATPAVAGEKHDGTNPHDAKMDQYAAISRKVGAANQVALCDLRKAFIESLKTNNRENKPRGVLTYDGIHMSPKGNELLANEFARSIIEAMANSK